LAISPKVTVACCGGSDESVTLTDRYDWFRGRFGMSMPVSGDIPTISEGSITLSQV
jgi:hypothetical protein